MCGMVTTYFNPMYDRRKRINPGLKSSMCLTLFAVYPEGVRFNSPGSSEAPPWVSDRDSPYPEGVTQKQDLFGQFHFCVTPSG